ncbi:hypothetical protein BJX70DRAFT_392597 [Aspergillus crustosus]
MGGERDEIGLSLTEEKKKQRKRVQNRINQRARRERIQKANPECEELSTGAGAGGSRVKRRPYQVERWRVGELEFLAASTPSFAETTEAEASQENPISDPATTTSVSASASTVLIPPMTPVSLAECFLVLPLSPDHTLLHLIHYNVSRGLRRNKEALYRFTSHYMPSHGLDHALSPSPSPSPNPNPNPNSSPIPNSTPIHPDILFYGSSLISSFLGAGILPTTLAPTESQMSRLHATWINLLPFPRMRENMITREKEFDHAEFVGDIIGTRAGVDTRRLFSRPPTAIASTGAGAVGGSNGGVTQMVIIQGDDDEITSDRNGLILWDEPHRVESWEATPGFLRKWMWTLEGCEELIESSNRWRRVRGEDPIRVIPL